MPRRHVRAVAPAGGPRRLLAAPLARVAATRAQLSLRAPRVSSVSNARARQIHSSRRALHGSAAAATRASCARASSSARRSSSARARFCARVRPLCSASSAFRFSIAAARPRRPGGAADATSASPGPLSSVRRARTFENRDLSVWEGRTWLSPAFAAAFQPGREPINPSVSVRRSGFRGGFPRLSRRVSPSHPSSVDDDVSKAARDALPLRALAARRGSPGSALAADAVGRARRRVWASLELHDASGAAAGAPGRVRSRDPGGGGAAEALRAGIGPQSPPARRCSAAAAP
jgi:hypothetical protein